MSAGPVSRPQANDNELGQPSPPLLMLVGDIDRYHKDGHGVIAGMRPPWSRLTWTGKEQGVA